MIAADECYSELYLDEAAPPPGLLQAAAAMGNHAFGTASCFHSLSKRSNAPGPALRASSPGTRELIERFFHYRTYHGCAMPLPTQSASIAAWSDEAHVRANRALYREKFAAVVEILDPVLPVAAPPAGFLSVAAHARSRTPNSSADLFAAAARHPAARQLPVAHRRRATTRPPTASAWPWSRRWMNASRPPGASAALSSRL